MNAKDFIMQQPMHRERWVFTDEELKNPQACQAYDQFIAYVSSHEVESSDTVGVIVYRNGTVSDTWEDGTRGVPASIRELAGAQEELHEYDPDGAMLYASNWYDVDVNDQGNFIGFVTPPELRS